MRSSLLILAVIVLSGWPAGAAELLADFEAGVDGWWTNPFGGGRITATASDDARFGHGALRADYELVDGQLNGNLVGPFLASDAPWRQQSWGALSLWYKTAGEQPEFTLSLSRLAAAGQAELSFSRQLPASAEWRQFRVYPRELWNRQRQRLDLSALGRIIVRSNRPGTIWLDHFALEPLGRRLPLRPYTAAFALTALDPTGYRIDGPARPWQVTLSLPGGKPTAGAFGGQGIPELELPGTPTAEGRGTLTIREGDASTTYTFPVLLPPPPVTIAPLGILPTPKQVVAGDGFWTLPDQVVLHITGSESSGARLVDHLHRDFGREVELHGAQEGPARMTLGEAEFVEPPPAERGPEAYRLEVTATGAAVTANDRRGLFYGVLTLLQMIGQASPPGAPVRCPVAAIVDWPDLPLRAASIPLPTSRWGYPNNPTVDPRLFIDFLDREVVARKYNTVVLLCENGVKYASPELAMCSSPNAWTPEQLERVLSFLRSNHVEPIPLLNSLGHANWLLIWHPELADRMAGDDKAGKYGIIPDVHTLDPRQPGAFELLTTAYSEVIGWFKPQRFHIGMDEVRWQIDHIPTELRGPQDTIEGRDELFAAWVKRLHDWLAEQGIGTCMWTDQLTAGHNGGPPYHTARALAQIPRDVWMFNWSSSLAPLHTYELADLGFETVLEANSYGVNRERGMVVQGNCVGIWDKLPWLAETIGRPSEYDYQKLLHGAEYGWRLHPNLAEPKPGPDRAFALAVREVEATATTLPEPAAGPRLLPLGEPAADDAAPVPFWREGVGPGGSVTVGRRAASLWWWQRLDADDEALTALRDGIKDPANLAGVPVGTVRVTYQDGTSVEVPVKFGWDIRPARPTGLPAAYGAVSWELRGETAVYLRQWVNPAPEKVIAEVGVGPGRVVLLGLAAREVKR